MSIEAAIMRYMRSNERRAGGVYGQLVGRSAVRSCPRRTGGAAVLPGGRLQDRHRRATRHQPVSGRAAARLRARERARPDRDRAARRRPRRGPVGRAVLGLRPQAGVRVQLRRRRVAAAAAAGRGGRPGADGPDQAGRRARPVLVAGAERPHGRAHPAPALSDRAAHRRGAAARRPGPARSGQERGAHRRRARPRVLRADAARRRPDGGRDPPPGRHRRGVRPRAERDHRGGRDRRVGARAVDDLRRGDDRGAGGADRPGRPRGAGRGVHRGRRPPARHAARQSDDRHAGRVVHRDPIRPCRRLRRREKPRGAGRDPVRRPAAPCWRATHALLDHLARVGFDGAPRVLATGPASETLSYVEGRAAVPPLAADTLTDNALVSVADLLRRYHQAASSFDPAGYDWPRPVPARYRTGLVSHNDVYPANLVFRGGRAVALIDFDLAGPGSAAWDFAAAARSLVPLLDEADVADVRRGRAVERFRILLAASGLPRAGRRLAAEAVLANHDWTYAIVTDAAAAGHQGFADHWRAVAPVATRARRWCQRHRRDLLTAAR